jgi:predicted NBD/HSP70 family sugar kinase
MAQIIRSDDLRKQNRETVLRALRRGVTLSRTALCQVTGFSPATVSAIAAGLLDEGVLLESREGGGPSQKRGRPQVALSLNPNVATVATASLTLNQVSVALIDYAGALIEERTCKFNTAQSSSDELVSAIADTLRHVLRAHPKKAKMLMEIAVGIQGVTDARGRQMMWSPITPVRQLMLSSELEARFGVPVLLSNDCNMIAEGLRFRDPQHFGSDFAALLLWNGIGMGLYFRDHAFTGVRSSAAEFGHMIHIPHGARCRCGNHGCIEAYAGDYAIWRRAKQQTPDAAPDDNISGHDMQELAERARAAPGPERDAYAEAGTAIGTGLSNLFALIDPVPVALVGSGAAAYDLMDEEIRAAILDSLAGSEHGMPEIYCFAEEHPLIRDGCLITALKDIDRRVFAPGNQDDGALKNAS